MTAVAAALLLVSGWLAVWSYVLYPPWIRWMALRQPPREPPPGGKPLRVDVLVSAADEQEVIAGRVHDLLAQEFPGEYAISIGCDGCTDATAARAREAAAGQARVRVHDNPVRRGKASVLNDLIAASEADVLVFTDANTRFEPGAVAALLAPFSEDSVGAVCGRLLLEGREGAGAAEQRYWDSETRLKEAEGRLGVCLGANGAIYAARRGSIAPLPADTALDDFLIPARIAGRGEAVVFSGHAVAREHSPGAWRREASRRFRIGVGAGQVLRYERWLWSLQRPALAFVFFSRKAARWLSPVAFLLAIAAALASPALWPWIAVCLTGAFLVFAALPRGSRLYYFGVMNVALAAGVLAGLFGYRRPAWKPHRTPD
jgi:cellulose synthase/poly-beta-1,6-N-acetylglucosamine synthase-like glycosyltransferase